MPMPGDVSRIWRIVSAKIPEPAVGQVVAGDAGHDDVLEAHRADRLGDAARLVVIEPGRPAGLDRAEPAGPGAGVAEDHDRGRALVPALPDVGAVGLLADRVEVQAAQQALEVVVVLAGRHPGPDPVRVPAEGHASRRPLARRPRRRPARSAGPAVAWAAGARPAGGVNIGSSRAIARSVRRAGSGTRRIAPVGVGEARGRSRGR